MLLHRHHRIPIKQVRSNNAYQQQKQQTRGSSRYAANAAAAAAVATGVQQQQQMEQQQLQHSIKCAAAAVGTTTAFQCNKPTKPTLTGLVRAAVSVLLVPALHHCMSALCMVAAECATATMLAALPADTPQVAWGQWATAYRPGGAPKPHQRLPKVPQTLCFCHVSRRRAAKGVPMGNPKHLR